MKFEELIKSLSPERYDVLKRSVELGKWPDGRLLGKEERETSLQILIAYDAIHKAEEDRIGYVDTNKKTECGHEDGHKHDDEHGNTPPEFNINNLIIKN